MSDDNVIELSTRLAEAPPVDLLEHRYDECKHPHVVVDDRHRTVACRDCGREPIDPIEALLGLARTWRRWRHEYEQLKKARAEEDRRRQESWQRRAERHLRAHPTHRLDAARRSWTDEDCPTCMRLEISGQRWLSAIAAMPPPATPGDPA